MYFFIVILLYNRMEVVLCQSYSYVKVGVVVDSNTITNRTSMHEHDQLQLAKIGLSAMKMSLSDFYSANPHYKTRLLLHPHYCPHNDVVASADAVIDLIKNVQVGAIIGPTTSNEAQFDIELGNRAHVPVICYSATSPYLSSSSSYFVQATQVDSVQIPAIVSIIQTFGWTRVIPVYVENDFGAAIIPPLMDALLQVGIQIPYRSVISSLSTDIDKIEVELYKLRSMETRVFIVHMDPFLGKRFFTKAEEIGMSGKKALDYVWIITNGIGNGLQDFNAKELDSMQGVIGVRTYVKETKRLEDFKVRWRSQFIQENPDEIRKYPRMNVYGLWAYDAIEALTRAIEKVVGTDAAATFHFQQETTTSSSISNSSSTSFNYPSMLGRRVSPPVGPKLMLELKHTRFSGLAGEFILNNGKLQSSILKIVNVIGNGEKTIGYWTSKYGLVKELNSPNMSLIPNDHQNLGSIIWPGDQRIVPKGWVLFANNMNGDQKKLKILVPIKPGFTQFVKVTTDPSTKRMSVDGYCIDIFDTVMKSLPYPVSYEYVPYGNPNRRHSRDELVSQVYYKKADALVGDTAITANRSRYVKFTMPYTDSGVAMLVPIKETMKKKAWTFLRPFSWDLWVTSLCFFLFIAFVVWVLEHRINPQFRGPPGYQVGTSLYYSFSTIVFSNPQQVFSNLARLVMIVWIFVMMILTQSYTASLASMLTVEQLQPTIADVQELVKSRQFVGYQQGSFVKEILTKQLKFETSKLRAYESTEELHELLLKGTENGGISVAFDEIPYLKVFMAKYFCNKYMLVPPTYKASGFGFVFQRGSPIVDDISQAILQVTEGEEIIQIENKWFGRQESCSLINNSSTTSSSSGQQLSSSDSLDLESFWALFTIVGIIAIVALIAYLVTFLYQHRRVWLRDQYSYPNNASKWTRIKELVSIFDQKNMESHTFRRSSSSELHSFGNVDAANSSTFNSRSCPSNLSGLSADHTH